MLATRRGSRTPRLYHNSDRSVGSADQCSLLNPRFEPSMATRGRRPPQHASSEQVGGRPHSRRSPGGLAPRPHSRRSPEGLAHQSSELARYFGKSPRNLMPGSETVAGRLRVATRGGCRPNRDPIRGSRQGHRRFFERTSTLHWVGYNRLTSL